ncbi:hypothetical protein BDR05DRAFT_1035972 [Suillus weaverae]|nr:hypothetical protein BDR05DRAFT_1035972 [Suillus weaverae]
MYLVATGSLLQDSMNYYPQWGSIGAWSGILLNDSEEDLPDNWIHRSGVLVVLPQSGPEPRSSIGPEPNLESSSGFRLPRTGSNASEPFVSMVSFFPPPPCKRMTSSLSADKNCILECSKGTVESLALEGRCEGVRKEILSPTSAKFFIGLLIGVTASRPFHSTSATTPASASTSSAAASANVIHVGTAGITSAAVAALPSSISSPSFSSSSSSLLLLSSVVRIRLSHVVEPGSNTNRTSRTCLVMFGPGFGQMAEPEPVVRFGVRKICPKNWTEPDFGSTRF